MINSVLQSIPLYLLSAVIPPKCIIYELHKIFNRFLWSTKEEGKSKHWVAWDLMCFPIEEGRVGFRNLFDISKAMFAKLWWVFRTTTSMWSNYMWNKYYKKLVPTLVQWKNRTQIWKKNT